RYAQGVSDLLNSVQPGELPDAHAHGVARMNQTIGTRKDSAVSPIGISRRPAPRPVNFTRANWPVADRSAGQEPVAKGDRVHEQLKRRTQLPVRRSQRASGVSFGL